MFLHTHTSISLCSSILTLQSPCYSHNHTHLPTQPGECPVVLEVTTDEGASSDALPVTAIVPEARSRPQSYSAGPVCFWWMYGFGYTITELCAQNVWTFAWYIIIFIRIWSTQLKPLIILHCTWNCIYLNSFFIHHWKFEDTIILLRVETRLQVSIPSS